MQSVGLALIIISWIIYGVIFVIPFFNLNLKLKVLVCAVSYCSSHIVFWTGVLIVGKEIAGKYKIMSLLRRLKRMHG